MVWCSVCDVLFTCTVIQPLHSRIVLPHHLKEQQHSHIEWSNSKVASLGELLKKSPALPGGQFWPNNLATSHFLPHALHCHRLQDLVQDIPNGFAVAKERAWDDQEWNTSLRHVIDRKEEIDSLIAILYDPCLAC